MTQTPHAVLFEMAFGADLTDPASWVWTDLTERVARSSPLITRGRSDEAGRAQPASFAVDLRNNDDELTPDNANSPHWPYVDLGTPCRVSTRAGSPHLAIDGSSGARARTPDHSSLDITGNFWAKIDLTVPYWPIPGGASAKIVGKFATLNRSWVIRLADDTVGLLWSTDGAASGELAAVSTIPLSMPPSHRLTLALEFIADDGDGGRIIRFHHARRWTDTLAVHESITQTGTTSIFSGTSPLDIGDVSGSGFPRPLIEVHRFELRSGGAGGTLVADPDFGAQSVGATGFVDPAGKTWSVDGAAVVTDKQTRLVGEVSSLEPVWVQDSPAPVRRTTVTVAGVTRRLAQGDEPLQSALLRLATASHNIDRVIGYWPFEDGSNAAQVGTPISGARPLGIGGELRFAGDDTLAGSKALVEVSGGQPAGWIGPVPVRTGITNWAVDFFVRIPTRETEPASTVLGFADSTGTVRSWRFAISSTTFRIRGTNADGTAIVDTSFSAAAWTSDWTQVRLQLTLAGGTTDWEIKFGTVGSGISSGLSGSYSGSTGRPTQWRTLDAAPPDGWSFGQLIFTTDIPEFDWLAPADLGWPGEPAAERFVRLCEEEGVAASVYGDRTVSEPMGPQRPLTRLSLLAECVAADMGVQVEQRYQPGLNFRTRTSMYNQVPLVLDRDQRQLVEPFRPVKDDQAFHNDVTVTRENGSSERVVDPLVTTGQKARYDDTVTLNLAADSQALQQAGWRYALGTWQGMRYPAVATELRKAPGLVDAWLDAAIGDRVQVRNAPSGNPAVVELLADGTEETFHDGLQWFPAVNAQPGGPWLTGVLDVAGTPTTALARLGTDGSELFAGVDQDDVSLLVTVTDGPGWTTDAAYYPMDLVLGGEVVTATSCVFFGVFVFTVVRGVNGVVKSHDTGAVVQVNTPIRLAL